MEWTATNEGDVDRSDADERRGLLRARLLYDAHFRSPLAATVLPGARQRDAPLFALAASNVRALERGAWRTRLLPLALNFWLGVDAGAARDSGHPLLPAAVVDFCRRRWFAPAHLALTDVRVAGLGHRLETIRAQLPRAPADVAQDPEPDLTAVLVALLGDGRQLVLRQVVVRTPALGLSGGGGGGLRDSSGDDVVAMLEFTTYVARGLLLERLARPWRSEHLARPLPLPMLLGGVVDAFVAPAFAAPGRWYEPATAVGFYAVERPRPVSTRPVASLFDAANVFMDDTDDASVALALMRRVALVFQVFYVFATLYHSTGLVPVRESRFLDAVYVRRARGDRAGAAWRFKVDDRDEWLTLLPGLHDDEEVCADLLACRLEPATDVVDARFDHATYQRALGGVLRDVFHDLWIDTGLATGGGGGAIAGAGGGGGNTLVRHIQVLGELTAATLRRGLASDHGGGGDGDETTTTYPPWWDLELFKLLFADDLGAAMAAEQQQPPPRAVMVATMLPRLARSGKSAAAAAAHDGNGGRAPKRHRPPAIDRVIHGLKRMRVGGGGDEDEGKAERKRGRFAQVDEFRLSTKRGRQDEEAEEEEEEDEDEGLVRRFKRLAMEDATSKKPAPRPYKDNYCGFCAHRARVEYWGVAVCSQACWDALSA